jgi:Ca2+-binding RTX toxin-like protein
MARIQFKVINNAIPYRGESWGAFWSNFDGDNFPELWVTNHQSRASLWRNLGDGTFEDIAKRVFGKNPPGDDHGAAFFDFDNNGQVDFIQQVASDFGGNLTLFYENRDGKYIEQGKELRIGTPLKGRSPLAFDYNQDGQLDVLVNGISSNGTGPTVFRQISNRKFVNANATVGFAIEKTRFALLSDITGDRVPEVLIDGGQTIFDTASGKFKNITTQVLGKSTIKNAEDAIATDFNNDLQPDIFITRAGLLSQTRQFNAKEFRSYLDTDQNPRAQTVGNRFKAEGTITFTIPQSALKPIERELIFIGGKRFNPTLKEFNQEKRTLRLNANDPRLAQFKPPGKETGLYINYNQDSQKWETFLVADGRRQTYMFVSATQGVRKIETVGFSNDQQFNANQLLINNNGRLVDRSEAAGFKQRSAFTAGRNTVAGDFDNDGDQDIYVLSTGYAANVKNVLFSNDGYGKFTPIKDAWGAEGTQLGLADAVTTVDYNGDGFLDLFATNGAFFNGEGKISREYYNDAPYELFENQGNSNHWLQVNLVGVYANRDGIGSRLVLTSDDGSTTTPLRKQLREQNGGFHARAQNYSVLHFGLAQDKTVESLDIQWLGGIRQILRGLSVDRIHTITENLGMGGSDTLIGRESREVLDGRKGDDTLIGNGGNDDLLGDLGGDRLEGGGGKDTLLGGGGQDQLVGGADYDRFSYNNLSNAGDTILDFKSGEDCVEVDGSSFGGGLRRGELARGLFALGIGAADAGDRFIYSERSGQLFFDPDGTGRQKQILLLSVNDGTVLRASDIEII